MRIQNSSAAQMEELQQRVQTSLDVLVTPRSMDVVPMGWKKLKEKTSRAVCLFHLLLGQRVLWRKIEDHVGTSPSNGTSTRSMVVARGFGMEVARATRIDSRRRKNVSKCVCSPKEKVKYIKHKYYILLKNSNSFKTLKYNWIFKKNLKIIYF